MTVTLSADPERTVAIPVTKTNQGGVQDLRLRGDPGRGGRRWGEREAGLRRAAHRGVRGLCQPGYGLPSGLVKPSAGVGDSLNLALVLS